MLWKRWNQPSSSSRDCHTMPRKRNWKNCLVNSVNWRIPDWFATSKTKNLDVYVLWFWLIAIVIFTSETENPKESPMWNTNRNHRPARLSWKWINSSWEILRHVQVQVKSNQYLVMLIVYQFLFQISVAISAPPPKAKSGQHSIAPENQVGLGQGRRSNIPKGDQKPRLSFIPRSVQKAVQGSSSGANGGPSTSSAPPPRSNDDFRKLFQNP